MAQRHLGWMLCRAAPMVVAALLGIFAVDAIAAAPHSPELIEPAAGAAPLSPEDVHMVAVFADDDGDEHLCSDWEIWSAAPAEAVWRAHCALGQEKVHVHLGDGEFVNSHAGRTSLLDEADYEVRVRFRDDSGEPAEEWSEWAVRPFVTRPPGSPGSEAQAWTPRPGYEVEVFAEGLQLPVSIAMVPEPGPHPGDPLMYVTELYGAVKVISRDGTVRDYATGLLNFDPTGAFPGSGEIGVAGIAVDSLSGDVLVSLVYEDVDSPLVPNPHYPKVVRLHSDAQGLSATGETTVLDMVGEAQGASHQISHLEISPDGDLYVHNGEGGVPSTARDLDSFRGKILRMSLSGEPLETNPFFDESDGISARDYVYASGFRNPFGGAWRIADGAYFEVENGPETDRLARVFAGADYLWDGSDETMIFGASYNWKPSHAPVSLEFVEPGRFGGSGFPAEAMGNAFVTESGPTWASGPQVRGKRIVEFGIASNGELLSGPEALVEYSGTGKATAVGLAAGADGLYFTDLYKDTGFVSPIDRGANVLRVRYCGASCPERDEQAQPLEQQRPDPLPAPPASDTTAPEVAGFRIWRKAFAPLRPAPRPVGSAARRGSAFLYSLSEPAVVAIEIGRLGGKRLGVVSAPGQAGLNRHPFSGWLTRSWLSPGRYWATILVRDAAGNAAVPHVVRFRVLRETVRGTLQ
jgi:glucose/arabinose dehydrogenase